MAGSVPKGAAARSGTGKPEPPGGVTIGGATGTGGGTGSGPAGAANVAALLPDSPHDAAGIAGPRGCVSVPVGAATVSGSEAFDPSLPGGCPVCDATSPAAKVESARLGRSAPSGIEISAESEPASPGPGTRAAAGRDSLAALMTTGGKPPESDSITSGRSTSPCPSVQTPDRVGRGPASAISGPRRRACAGIGTPSRPRANIPPICPGGRSRSALMAGAASARTSSP